MIQHGVRIEKQSLEIKSGILKIGKTQREAI
jgi:hypothetical protein